MRKLFITAILAASLGAQTDQPQPKESTASKLHWSDKRADADGDCSIWHLYDDHERVAKVAQCKSTDGDFLSIMDSEVWGVFDDLDAAKKRSEEVYKHRNQEKAAPKEKPAKLAAIFRSITQ